DSNELFQKLLKDLKELAEYDQSTRTDHPIFLNNNEDHLVQNKESPKNYFEETVVSKTNQEPPQDSDIHQLIEECSIKIPEEQKQKMENTMFELVKICQEKEFFYIHDDVNDLIESALDSKLLLINSNSQRLDKKEQEVKNVVDQPAERRNQIPTSDFDFEEEIRLIENLLYDNSFLRPPEELNAKIADTIIESIPLPITVQDVPDPVIVSVEEENVVHQEEEEVDLEDISQVQDAVLREKLFSITRLISNIESLNDNSTPDRALKSFEFDNSLLDNYSPEFETFCDHSKETISGNTTHANYSLPEYDSFCFEIEPDQERLINLVENDNSDSSNDPLLEEVDLFLSDNSIPPGIENVADDPEGDIRFLKELLIDDSILSHESFYSNFKENPSNLRPPLEPPDDNFDLEPKVISAVMEDIDEPDEHFNPGGEIFVSTNNENVDYFPFMFVIRIFLPYLILPEISPLFLFAESGDTIFDPSISD
nr:hypothetical protein [Tanacetum cinerariifolium]